VAVVATALGVTVVPSPGGTAVVQAAPAEQRINAAGPLGPITVLGDSVLLGSILTSPTLADQLAARGWGPIRLRAGEGYRTGLPSAPASSDVSAWIQSWRSQGWDPVDVVINLGANDSGFCNDVACAKASIMHLVNVIGPGHRIWWPKITRFYTYSNQQNAWNAALDQVDAERADFWTWDWPTEMRTGGYVSHDMTHLDAPSYRKRSFVMAREITADLAFARRTGPDAPLPVAIGSATAYTPLPPERVRDTRAGGAAPPSAGAVVDVDMTPYVPAGTTAVAVNLTTDQSRGPGYLTGYPCDRTRQEVSNVNHAAGVPRGAFAVVPLSASGHLCVFTLASGHVIVDLQGAFGPETVGTARLTPLPTPGRLLDTRDTGRSTVMTIPVASAAGADAAAVAVNLTATGAAASGWLKAYSCDDDVPPVSNVNFLPGDTVASSAFVPVSASDTICVQSSTPVDVVVDITGVFRAGTGLRFVPSDPTRVLDTRIGTGGWAPIQGSGQTLDVRAAPPGAQAVTGTLTIVTPTRGDWLKAYPCGAVPPTSSVNSPPDGVFANGVTVGVDSNGDVCILALAATQSVLDVTGWWVS
jgi:hypothetical protein